MVSFIGVGKLSSLSLSSLPSVLGEQLVGELGSRRAGEVGGGEGVCFLTRSHLVFFALKTKVSFFLSFFLTLLVREVGGSVTICNPSSV